MTNIIENYWPIVLMVLGLVSLGVMFRILRKPELGLYLTFFATGILLSPNLPVVREKLSGAEFIMTFTWLVLLIRPSLAPNPPPLSKAQKKALGFGGLFIFWIILSFAFNGLFNPEAYIRNANSLVETCNFIYGYLMFVSVVLMIRDWEQWKNCLKGWLGGSVVVAFFGVLAFSGHGPSWSYDPFTHRVCSTLRTENQVPSFLLPIFVLLVFMTVERGRKPGQRWALMALLAGTFLTSLGTGSRTAFLMLFIAVFEVFYVAKKEWRFQAFNSMKLARMFTIIFFTMVLYIFLALANYHDDYLLGRTPAWQRPVVMMYEWIRGNRDLDDGRINQLEVVSENIGDNLIVGTGPKNYGRIYEIEEIHNTYAGMLFQTGIPGLIFLLLWLWSSLLVGWKASRRSYIPQQRLFVLCMVSGMVLILFYGLTIFGLRQRNIWLLAGLLVAADSFVPRRRDPDAIPNDPKAKWATSLSTETKP